MIPLRLTLKNFLSYGPSGQTINFEPYSLMCLSGRNGHGKSAILDAITWAVWGCARKMLGVAKGDDGLVHLGQKEMVIHLEFVAGGQKYRIRREFFKSYGKPVTRLDVELFDINLNHYVTLTDKSIRATQEKIEEIVGVDFATFVSTSFLRQGQSNEFSKKTPRERKEIIASIIGLATFDARAAQALERSKEFAQKILQIQFGADQALRVAGELPAIEVDLASMQQQAQGLDDALALLSKDLEISSLRFQKVDSVRQDAARADAELKSSAAHEQALITKLLAYVHSWRALHAKLIGLPPLDTLLAQRSACVARFDVVAAAEKTLHEASALREALNKEILVLQTELKHNFELKKTEIVRKKNEALTQKKYLLSAHADLAGRIQRIEHQHKELIAQRVACINQLAQRGDIETAYDASRKLFEKRKAFYHSCVSKRSMAQAALLELAERKDVVGLVESPACPLCEQLLTLKRKQFLLHQMGKQERLAQHKLARAISVLKSLEEVLKAQRSQLELDARLCSSFQVLEQDLIRFNREVLVVEHELEGLRAKEREVVAQLNDLERSLTQLEQDTLACDAAFDVALKTDERIFLRLTQVHQLSRKIALVEYDAHEHQELKTRLAQLDSILSDAQKRAVHFEESLRLRHSALQCIQEIRRIRHESGVKKETLRGLLQIISSSDDGGGELRELEARKGVLSQEREQTSRSLGSLMERKQRALLAQIQRDESLLEIEHLTQEKKEYEMLVDAFGKNGIQALLIEEILPEVEHEANALLARLTDNQMQIFIESLRDLKSGGVRETLDIQISDSVGVRPYEMFSGGEAFRIDFALRIAVSKLLARRAGTHLQTLFIDEGFGSQDEEGLSRLTQALFAVQRDFEKIIVVSHLERLKENFPVHIVVDKRSGGSVVQIEERG